MENKKEGILKQFWNKLKNFWNNLGIDVVDYKFTDDGFQKEIDKRGVDEELRTNSAENCAEKVLQPEIDSRFRAALIGEALNPYIIKRREERLRERANARRKANNEERANAKRKTNNEERDDNAIE